jgi:hypothetical protein
VWDRGGGDGDCKVGGLRKRGMCSNEVVWKAFLENGVQCGIRRSFMGWVTREGLIDLQGTLEKTDQSMTEYWSMTSWKTRGTPRDSCGEACLPKRAIEIFGEHFHTNSFC